MYSISDDRSRRPGRFPGYRELPVLFHLRDVSLPRPPAPGDNAAPAALPATIALPPAPPADILSAEPPVAEPTLVNPPAVSLTLSPVELPITPPAEASQAPTATEPSGECVTAAATASDEQCPPAAESTCPPTIENTTATEPSTTLRPQASQRRRPKTSASEDWFAAHGKFIAVAFVLALIGTIYLARTNRQPVQSAAKTTAKAEAVAQHHPKSDPVVAEQKPDARTANLVNTVSATTESKADLFPPTSVASAAPDGDQSQGKDGLFVFKSPKPGDDRVAASQPKQPVSAPPLATTPSASGAPALAPSYPATPPPPAYPTAPVPAASYPQTAAPPLVPFAAPPSQAPPSATQSSAAPSPQANYPATSQFPAASQYPVAPQPPAGPTPGYRSQYQMPAAQMPPQQQQTWSPPMPAGSMPGQYQMPSQYQPSGTSALGPRYERTGSGNY